MKLNLSVVCSFLGSLSIDNLHLTGAITFPAACINILVLLPKKTKNEYQRNPQVLNVLLESVLKIFDFRLCFDSNASSPFEYF